MAATLQSRGVKAETVLDEGGAVVVDGLFGVSEALSLIAVAEKVGHSVGGHAVHVPGCAMSTATR